jgi:hypothetical protein
MLVTHKVEPQRQRHQGGALPVRLAGPALGRLDPQLVPGQVLDVEADGGAGEARMPATLLRRPAPLLAGVASPGWLVLGNPPLA